MTLMIIVLANPVYIYANTVFFTYLAIASSVCYNIPSTKYRLDSSSRLNLTTTSVLFTQEQMGFVASP